MRPRRSPRFSNVPSRRASRVATWTTAVVGIRDLHPDSEPEVELAVAEEIGNGATELRFGDARGSDEVALGAACAIQSPETALKVFVLSSLDASPRSRRSLFAECSEVVELGLRPGAKWSYDRQADALLEGADRLLAFTDGRESGGTWAAVEKAVKAGIGVTVVYVLSVEPDAPDRTPRRARARNPLVMRHSALNPQILLEGARAPIHGIFKYASPASRGRGRRVAPPEQDAWVTKALLQLEAYSATTNALNNLADAVSAYVMSDGHLREAEAIVAMPRRDPAARNALAPLAEAVAARTDKVFLPEWLVRATAPSGTSVTIGGRTHFKKEDHAASLAVQRAERPDGVIVLDDVIAYTGTMIGAQIAVERDTGTAPFGLAVTFVPTLPHDE